MNVFLIILATWVILGSKHCVTLILGYLVATLYIVELDGWNCKLVKRTLTTKEQSNE